MRSQAVHDNSISAFHQEEAKLSRREQAIYDWIVEHGPHTDRQVMEGMGFRDMNNVRPRISELIVAGKLMEVGDVICSTSNKRVRRVDIRRPRVQVPLFS